MTMPLLSANETSGGFPDASKVQLTLQTIASGSTIQADIDALLEYIMSL